MKLDLYPAVQVSLEMWGMDCGSKEGQEEARSPDVNVAIYIPVIYFPYYGLGCINWLYVLRTNLGRDLQLPFHNDLLVSLLTLLGEVKGFPVRNSMDPTHWQLQRASSSKESNALAC